MKQLRKLYEGVRRDIIDAYIANAGEISFSKTANRSMVARLNNTVREVCGQKVYEKES
ncbi:DUF6933 domain-containing protein [Pseudogracilibacillus sp. SO30301A]|uniref:DUF6933 domain-containing protein n=1 Tax=Pseudogracilibacillus sp. SO30301A TaxID=3098291 RepID=UPI003FA6D972